MTFERRLLLDPAAEECTIAVLSGSATADGRPMLWKNRDTGMPPNEVIYLNDGPLPGLALVTAGETGTAWLGVNVTGFAVCNALSYNIPDSSQTGITNGALMKLALQRCASVEDFESLLVATNERGRQNPANLGVIDGLGGAAMFEVGSHTFTRFDATDPLVAPEGFLVRANFSMGQDTSRVSSTWRYRRAHALVRRDVSAGGENVTGLLGIARDLMSAEVDPYPLPYAGSPPEDPRAIGYVNTEETINRRYTVSAGVITGVGPGEDPRLATFYALLGQPVLTAAVPLWVAAGNPPPEVDGSRTAPICDLAMRRAQVSFDIPYHGGLLNTHPLVEGEGRSYLRRAEAVETWLLPETSDLLQQWHGAMPSDVEMRLAEYSIARRMYAEESGTAPATSLRLSVLPNPSNGGVLIGLPAGFASSPSREVEIFDILGRKVASVRPGLPSASAGVDLAGSGLALWNGRSADGRRVSSGVYFLRTTGNGVSAEARLVLVR